MTSMPPPTSTPSTASGPSPDAVEAELISAEEDAYGGLSLSPTHAVQETTKKKRDPTLTKRGGKAIAAALKAGLEVNEDGTVVPAKPSSTTTSPSSKNNNPPSTAKSPVRIPTPAIPALLAEEIVAASSPTTKRNNRRAGMRGGGRGGAIEGLDDLRAALGEVPDPLADAWETNRDRIGSVAGGGDEPVFHGGAAGGEARSLAETVFSASTSSLPPGDDADGEDDNSAPTIVCPPADPKFIDKADACPPAVAEFLRVLVSYTDVEGIFRIPGSREVTTRIVTSMRADDFKVLHAFIEGEEIHDIAGAFKAFIRELPTPILTRPILGHFQGIDAAQGDDEIRIMRLQRMLNDMTPELRHTIGAMTHFFLVVIHNESLNKMGLSNIAMCFAPSFIGLEGNFGDVPISHKFICQMMMHADKLHFFTSPGLPTPPSTPAGARRSSKSSKSSKNSKGSKGSKSGSRRGSKSSASGKTPAPPVPPGGKASS